MRLLPCIVVAAALVCAGPPAHADQKVERTFEVSPEVTVTVSNPFGEVRIEGWDEPEVELEAQVNGDLDIDAERDHVEIELDFGLLSLFQGRRARIELRVPHGAEIEVDGVDTRIRVDDVNGELRLQTIQGDIRVEGAPTDAKLSTISGEIRFDGRGSNVHAQSISGNLRLRGIGSDLVAESTSGEVRVEGGAIAQGRIQTISGPVRVQASLRPGGRLDVETLSAPIRVALPRTTSTRMTLESTSGEVRSSLGEEDERTYRGGRLDMNLGDSDGRVRLKSFSGEIRVEER